MVLRVLQFLVGAALAGGGGYLAWTERAGAANVFPPGPSGVPALFLVGLFGVTAGLVFLVSAVHPRPNQKRFAAQKAAREDAALNQAEAYYSERVRAADRDWRAADITPPVQPVAPAPAPPPIAPAQPAAPVRPAATVPPPPRPQVVPPPAPIAARPPAPPAAPAATVPPPPRPQAPVAAPVVAPPPADAVAPPSPSPFPSPVTLNPIPRPKELVEPSAKPAPPAPPAEGPYAAIRAAIASGKLAEAEKMLNTARDTATGLDLANLTALAGDHAYASNQHSHAKWLWRLALKRFGEHDAANSPEAQRIAASLKAPG